jgi:predicted acylesterase/phospholipase RssA
MSDNNKNTIYLGLCMAGAVSAGAYTAGVMDYLFEALDRWEKQKIQDPENTPSHRVEIPVIGGASAGGMTGIISASLINQDFPPVRTLDPGDILAQRPGNKLYHSWVDMLQEDMFSLMLNTGDIQNGKIYSLLNSDFIDVIAQRAIEVEKTSPINRAYISERLKVFVTLSNLYGFTYDLLFQDGVMGKSPYLVRKHADYACFEMSKSGLPPQYNDNGWIPLDFPTGLNTDIARQAAMATGAFPIGLRPRTLSRPGSYVLHQSWTHYGHLAYTPVHEPYVSLNVDGGLINNEPFERVFELLNQIVKEEHLESEAEVSKDSISDFRTTLLMIDPFPSMQTDYDHLNHEPELGSLIGKTFSAMMGQLQLKPSLFKKAFDIENGSHFLVSPKRKVPVRTSSGEISEETKNGAEAIAGGTLHGFGGFLHKEFRIHDFFLGRANCEHFLRNHFTVPLEKSHQILDNGYSHLSAERRNDFSGINGRGEKSLQIIPIFEPGGASYYMPRFENHENWPLRKPEDISKYRRQVRNRVDKLIMNMADLNRWDSFLLWAGKQVFLRRKLTNSAMDRIDGTIRGHGLYR